MTSPDLHPDDLIDREMQGELSPSEEQRLLAHLRRCSVCRLERLARQDFCREAEDPEADLLAQKLVAALIVPTSLQEGLRRPLRSRMRHFRLALVAAAVVSVAGWAAAASWSGVRQMLTAGSSRSATDERASVEVEAAAHLARVPPPPAPSMSDALDEPATASAAPVANQPPLARVTSLRPRPQHAPEPVASAPDPPASVPPPPDAAGLFGRATEARRDGDHERAAHFYRALIEDYPSSSEAHEALAVLGRLLLDDSDAEGALRCFEQYLRTGGALREDVMLGRALSLRRLGRIGDETRAWKDLVAEYPASVHAERARRRLVDLEGP